MPRNSTIQLKVVDFFCGAGGMSYGLHKAGLRILGGIDNSGDCQKTYESNVPDAKFIRHDISTLSAPSLGKRLNLRRKDSSLVFAGCSPCQFWSKIRTDKSKSAHTAFLLRQFQKFIRHFLPGFVVVENVPGLRDKKDQTLLPSFFKFLKAHGYVWDDGLVNSNHYGVPQNRIRYLLIATRLSGTVSLPQGAENSELVVRNFIGVANGFRKIIAGHRDESQFLHTASALSSQNVRRIQLTPKSGGDRSAWKNHHALQIEAYRGKDHIFRDVYGRMYWDRPAPTITTRFHSLSNGRFGHPDEDRAISIREGATLQTFPVNFIFNAATMNQLARQIGNAVPPEMARRIGKHLISIASHG